MAHVHKKPHPGGETRATIVSVNGTMLAHEESGKASLVPFEVAKRHRSSYRWKIEVTEADAEGWPQTVIIRNDRHPQKAIDNKFGLSHSHLGGWAMSVYWMPVPVKKGCCSPVYFKHKSTGAYLAVGASGGLLMESAEGPSAMWSLLPAKWAGLPPGEASWSPAAIFQRPPKEATAGEPVATAFGTYAEDATVYDEDVKGQTMKMVKCDTHCVFVYKKGRLADVNATAHLP